MSNTVVTVDVDDVEEARDRGRRAGLAISQGSDVADSIEAEHMRTAEILVEMGAYTRETLDGAFSDGLFEGMRGQWETGWLP